MNFEQSADIEANTPITVMAGQCLKWQRDRIAALEAENAVMRQCLTDIRDNYDCDRDATWHVKHCRCCNAAGALSYKYEPTLTPEGGGK